MCKSITNYVMRSELIYSFRENIIRDLLCKIVAEITRGISLTRACRVATGLKACARRALDV